MDFMPVSKCGCGNGALPGRPAWPQVSALSEVLGRGLCGPRAMAGTCGVEYRECMFPPSETELPCFWISRLHDPRRIEWVMRFKGTGKMPATRSRAEVETLTYRF